MKSVAIFLMSLTVMCSPIVFTYVPVTYAQQDPQEDIQTTKFKLTLCDGPDNLKHIQPDGTYNKQYINPDFIPCDFKGLMLQIQRLINVMIILGVVAALGGFSYAGYLYVTGVPSKITKAYDIFRKIGIGLVLMLSAWAIVYQILAWLTNENQFKGLLN